MSTSAWLWLVAGRDLGELSGKECCSLPEEEQIQLESQAVKELMDSRLRERYGF